MPIRLVSMLRGINVGGQKSVKMDALKSAYEALGYTDVVTYIQSGNVVFTAAKNDNRLLNHLTAHLRTTFGFDIPVILRTHHDMSEIVERNPFSKSGHIASDKLHVTFLDEEPAIARAAALDEHDGGADEFRMVGREVYLHCPNGYGKTKLNNGFFEKKLAVGATTRNWNSVCKLAELSA